MQANKTVTINGRVYDAVTGLPIGPAPSANVKTIAPALVKKRAAELAASSVHTSVQRSQTLHRRSAKKTNKVIKRSAAPAPGRHMDIARSAKVSRFAPHPSSHVAAKKEPADKAPVAHPIAARAHATLAQRHSAKVAAIPTAAASAPSITSKQIKDNAIAAALSRPADKPEKERHGFKILSRKFIIASAIFVVVIVGAYITYTNVPSLSVSFAASQAGIKATYPEYTPDGYSLAQPVSYKDGEVSLNFASNSGAGGYIINQIQSSWDSSAVLDNAVKTAAGDNYITTQERGLTLYTYNKKTTWVNGGIWYTITNTAPLSGEQIRHIATSL